MKKIKWSGDKLLGVSALLISLATLISLVYQARIMREHEMKSSFPKLELWNNRNEDKYELILVNTGLGPAIIENIHIEYNDSIYNMDYAQFSNSYLDSIPNKDLYEFGYSNMINGRIIQAGQTVKLLHMKRDSVKYHPIEELIGQSKAKIVLKYSSVYEQFWALEGIGELPRLLDEEPDVIKNLLKE